MRRISDVSDAELLHLWIWGTYTIAEGAEVDAEMTRRRHAYGWMQPVTAPNTGNKVVWANSLLNHRGALDETKLMQAIRGK